MGWSHLAQELSNQAIAGKIEEKIEQMRRRGRSLKQLIDDLEEMRRYWKLKEEDVDNLFWKTYGLAAILRDDLFVALQVKFWWPRVRVYM